VEMFGAGWGGCVKFAAAQPTNPALLLVCL
jgi:hypothetical protein